MRLSHLFLESVSYEYHDELNQKLFDGDVLREDVRKGCLRIAKAFVEFLETDIEVVNVTFTGSNAAYNYTPHSDVDIHIISKSTGDPDLLEKYFRAKKHIWGATRDITVKGFPAECYVEDVSNPVKAAGVYSLLKNKWVKRPSHTPPSVDDSAVAAKVKYLKQVINHVLEADADAKDIGRLIEKLRKMRSTALETGGEFAVENIAFKVLRNDGLIDKLAKAKIAAEDDQLTIEGLAYD